MSIFQLELALEDRPDLWPDAQLLDPVSVYTAREELTARCILNAVHTHLQREEAANEQGAVLQDAIAALNGDELIAVSALLEKEVAADTAFSILAGYILDEQLDAAEELGLNEELEPYERALVALDKSAYRRYPLEQAEDEIPLSHQRINVHLQPVISQLFAFINETKPSDFLQMTEPALTTLSAGELISMAKYAEDLPFPYKSMMESSLFIVARIKAREASFAGNDAEAAAYKMAAAELNTRRPAALQAITARREEA